MPIQVTAYSCQYRCGRKVATKRKAMEEHEARCYHNPLRRACQSCANFTHEMLTVYNPDHGGDPGSTDYDVKVNYCAAEIDITKTLQCDCPLWSAGGGGEIDARIGSGARSHTEKLSD